MTNIDWAALSRLAPELIVLIVICGVMILTIDRIYKREKEREKERAVERKERDKSFADERKERDDAFLAALALRDHTWHAWMTEERQYHTKGLQDISADVKALSLLVTATNALIVAWERKNS